MCVAVLIESLDPIPPDNLKRMAETNPDGGGLAWIDGESVHYRKGLTWQEINEIQHLIPRPFLMHFRIATKGGKSAELTHPFPLGMQAFTDDLTGFAKAVIIHNGTWSGYNRYVPKGIDWNKVSDTQIAAYAAAFDEDVLDELTWSNALMRAAGQGRANITLRGSWTEHEGNQYSNLHWVKREYTSYHGYSGSYGANHDSESWESWKARHSGAVTAITDGAAYKRAREAVERDDAREERGKAKREKIARKAAKRARRDARKDAKGATLPAQDPEVLAPCEDCGALGGHYLACITREYPDAFEDLPSGPTDVRTMQLDLVDLMGTELNDDSPPMSPAQAEFDEVQLALAEIGEEFTEEC